MHNPLRPLFAVFVCMATAIPALAQQSTSVIKGTWNGDEPPPGTVTAELIELTTLAVLQERPLSSDGSFAFHDVPLGSYRIDLRSGGIVIASTMTQLESSLNTTVSFDDGGEAMGEGVDVIGYRFAERGSTSTSTVFTEPLISSIPTISGEKKIELILLNTPGVVPDEDGRFHVRGEDAQLQYIIDGIPVTANTTRVYGNLFDAELVSSMEIQTGALDAEYGTATAGVLVVNTKSGFDAPSFLRASGSYGSFDTYRGSIQAGGNLNGRLSGIVAASVSGSDRYLDPIADFDPLHDNGESRHIFAKGDWLAGSSFDLSLLTSINHTEFEVPNGTVKEPAQDQRQVLDDQLVGLRGVLEAGDNAVVSALGYWREASAKTTSGGLSAIDSPADSAKAVAENEKYFVGALRENKAYGGQLDFSTTSGWFGATNFIKAGVGAEIYPIDEYFSFAITNPALSNPDTAGGDARLQPYDLTRGGAPLVVDRSETGNRLSAYVQDRIEFGKWKINAGVRFDRFSLLDDETAVSPRVNALYAISDKVTLRASYNRIVMQAPVENILVSSSEPARQLAGEEQVGTPTAVHSEKAHVAELGVSYVPNSLFVIRGAAYGKSIEDFLVKAELGNSGIIFPLNLKTGIVAGGEVTAMMHEWHHLSARMTLSGGIAFGLIPEDGTSPIAAGLIIGEEGYFYSHPFSEEEHFPTEHSQLFAGSLNLRYSLPAGLFATLQGRFDSGLPFDLTDSDGNGLNPEESRIELRSRGYSDDVIDLLNLESERPGSPDKSVAPHGTIDLAVGVDLDRYLHGKHARLTTVVTNVFDTPYLYKFESSFGGTHFGQPRMMGVEVEVGI